MKKNLLLYGAVTMIVTALIIGISASQFESRYYYAFDQKILLLPIKNKWVVRYAKATNQINVNSAIQSSIPGVFIKWQDDKTAIISLKSPLDKEQLMKKTPNQAQVLSYQPAYSVRKGTNEMEMYITDEIIFQFSDSISQEQQKALHTKLGVTILKTTEFYQLARVSKDADALETANQYQESGLVKFAQPNFIARLETHQVLPNDPYFNKQFSFHNTGQVFTDGHSGTLDADVDAPEAWTITKGSSNITVAVLDDGVSANHPDLPNSRQLRLAGSNFADGDVNNVSPTQNSNHGNACAGIIGATQGNNEGISGIAPNCRIMPIRLIKSNESLTTVEQIAAAIRFAVNNGAHILSCSWGFGIDDPNLYPVIVSAIQYAVTTGRGGLGCVVVFSAGNFARHVYGDNGLIGFPACVTIPGVLTVGASDRTDHQADYSPSSDPNRSDQTIDLVAPSHKAYPPNNFPTIPAGIAGETSEIWSIDIPGNTGTNPYPVNAFHPPATGEQLPSTGTNFLAYTARFGGTSAACPLVAGIAALILSVNPALSQQQVFDMITNTADNAGGYVYTIGVSVEMGKGRANACNAIRQTLGTLQISGPSSACQSGASYYINNPAGAAITWNHSTNLTRISAPGANPLVVQSNSNGPAWIDASFTTPCGGVALYRKSIFSGVPSFYGPINGPDAICPNSGGYFSVGYVPGAASYTWNYSGLNYYSGGSSNDITLSTPFNFNGGAVQYTVSNECGTSNTFTKPISKSYNCPGYYSYSVSPNPSTDQITIKATPEAVSSTLSTNPATLLLNATTKKPKVEAKLYYFTDGSLVKTVRLDKEENIIMSKNMKRGKYILHILEDDKIVVVQQLVFE